MLVAGTHDTATQHVLARKSVQLGQQTACDSKMVRGSAFCALAIAAAVLGTSAEDPTMRVTDGHMMVSSGGVLTNLTDSVSATEVAEQTASVQRRSDGNLGDLMKQLITNYGENTKAVASMASDLVTALEEIHDIVNETSRGGANPQLTLTIQQNGEGTAAKTTGLPWNPIPALRLARQVYSSVRPV